MWSDEFDPSVHEIANMTELSNGQSTKRLRLSLANVTLKTHTISSHFVTRLLQRDFLCLHSAHLTNAVRIWKVQRNEHSYSLK